MTKRILSLAAAALAFAGLAGTAHAQASPSAYTSATRYDVIGRVTGTIAPDADGVTPFEYPAVRNTYDPAGRLIKVEIGKLASWQSEAVAPASWSGFTIYKTIETTYNAQGAKLTERIKGDNGVAVALTQFSYDTSGRLECTAVRMNPAVYASLPASACSLGTQGSQGPDRIARNVYDAAGQLTQVRNGIGTSLERAEVTYTYTNNGQIKYVIDAVGNKAEKRYDGFDRQVRWVFPSLTKPTAFNPSTPANAVATAGELNEADYEEYGYDFNSNRTSLRTRRGETIGYTYDFLNRVTVKDVPPRTGLAATHTRDVYYGYDLHGRQTHARFDSHSGQGVISQYDGFGRQSYGLQNLDGAYWSLSYWYDANGNREQMNFPDSASVTYQYDRQNRPTYVGTNGVGSFGYMYNERGELYHAWRGSSSAVQLGYDTVSRLHSLNINIAGTGDDNLITLASRNPANQIITRTNGNDLYAFTSNVNATRNYTTNGLNQYSNVAGTGYTYDANGNLTFDGTHTFVYDVENRLVSRTSAASSTTLRYDPLGRLYEVSDSVLGLTRFHHDGDAMVGEYNGAGQMVNRYVHGPGMGVDDPMVWFTGASMTSGTLRYFYGDERGSIAAVADVNGNKIRINAYDEYGTPGATNLGRFQYTGQVWLPELGMYYYKARMYSPLLGRFMQVDPIGYEDQFNLYAYVRNDPINLADPTGLDDEGSVLEQIAEEISSEVHRLANAIPGDLAEAAEELSEGNLAYFSSVPPTLGGGIASTATAARAAGASVAARDAAAIATAREAAAAAPSGSRGASAGLVTRDGARYTGQSSRSGGPGEATNARVAEAAEAVPSTSRSDYHGCCAEVNAMSNAANAGESLVGSVIATVRTEGGKVMDACSSCRAIARTFGIRIAN